MFCEMDNQLYLCDKYYYFALETNYTSVPNFTSIQVSDPLLDGDGCGPTTTCCYDLDASLAPYFYC